MTNVTCNKCGWVHFKVTRDYAEKEVADFNAFYDSADNKTRKCYSGRSKVENYERCMLCGNSYKDFRPTVEGDCPDGCTLNPIIQD